MKKLNLFRLPLATFIFMILQLTTFAQQKVCTPPHSLGDLSQFVGDWEGSFTYKNRVYDLNLNFKMEEEDLIASTSLPKFKILLTEFKTWICPSNEIHFSYNLPDDSIIEFNGKPVNNKIKGQFRLKEYPDLCVQPSGKFFLNKKSAKTLPKP